MKIRFQKTKRRILQAVIFGITIPQLFGFSVLSSSGLTRGSFISVAQAAGVPQIISYQGRLTDSSGTLLGTASGTSYFFKFSIYDAVSGGTKLWPASAPASTSASVVSGVFNVKIGDTGSGYPDALDFNFEDDEETYLQVEVASTSAGTYEAIAPRQRITAAGYAINSKTLRGFVPSQVASGSNVPVLSAGNLTLGGTNPQINATSTNMLVIQGGAGTGDLALVTNGGKVGIGTVSPSSTLHVVGNAIITATTTVRGKLVDASGNAYVTSTSSGVSSANGITGAALFAAAGPGLSVASSGQTITYTFTSSSLGLGTASVQNISAFLQTSNNLSDLTATSTARTNLGLGDIATLASSTFLKVANNGSDIVSTSTFRSNLGLGTAATQNISAFLQVANNGSDITSTSTFRSNLGLTDTSTLASSTWLKVANNLSDLTNTSTARTSLGLGDSATLASSTFLKVANNLSDVANTSTARTNLGLGDSATLVSSTFLKVTNNLSDLNNTSTARTNIGLGNVSNNLQLVAANNLSDLTSTSTARTNLGLGSAATLASTTWLVALNNLSDLNNTSTARTNIGFSAGTGISISALGAIANTGVVSTNGVTGTVNFLASGPGLSVASSGQNITYTFSSSSLGLGTASVQSIGTFLQVSNNLSDLTNTSTARTNLGLGDSATLASSTFLKVANNGSDINNTSTFRTNLGLGDSATLASSTFLKVANNLSDLNNTSTARTNIGLGNLSNNLQLVAANNLSDLTNTSTARTNLGLSSSATLASTTWLVVANNGSDINSTSTFRTNLGLGDSATLASSTFLKVANNFSDLNNTSTARTNLGLGSIATFASADYLTSSTAKVTSVNGISGLALFAAAGPGLSVASSSQTITYTFTSSTLGLGTASVQSIGTFLQTSNNLSDLTNTSTARTSLGLGDSATLASSTFLKVANNLSDLNNTSTARTNLGVGTVANGGTGNTAFTAGSIIFASSTTLLGQSNANLFWDNTNSRLGVGTSTPAAKLHINGGTGSMATGLVFGGGTVGLYEDSPNNLYVAINGSPSWAFNQFGQFVSTGFTGSGIYPGNYGNPVFRVDSSDSDTGLGQAAADILVLYSSGTSALAANYNRVGIGTLYPSSSLHVIGTATISATTTIQGKLVDASGNAYVTSTGGSGTVTTSTAVTAGYFPFWGSASALTGTSTLFASSTRIGVGTISPSTTLHVVGDFQVSSTALYVSSTSGFVGIGTTAPSAPLHVFGGGDFTALTLESNGAGLNENVSLLFRPASTALGSTVYAKIVGVAPGGSFAELAFYTAPAGAPTEKLRITGDGKFGFNTIFPSSTLHVISFATSSITQIIQATSTQTVDLTQWRSSSSAVLSVVDSTGRFGIGTASPSSTLHVVGNLRVSASSTFADQILATEGTRLVPGVSFSSDTGTGLWRASNVLGLALGQNTELRIIPGGLVMRASGVLGWGSGNESTSNDTGFARSAAGVVEINSGSVGTLAGLRVASTTIGSVNTPSSTLHVIGTLTVSATTTIQGRLVDASGNAYSTSTGGSGTVTTSTAVTAGYFPFWGSGSALTGTSTIFASSTRIGIGTISPSTTLHVVGDFQVSSTALYVSSTTGYVGIGTTAPTDALDIVTNGGNIRATLGNANAMVRYTSVCAGCGPDLSFVRGRNTFASPQVVEDGDVLGGFYFRGYDGSDTNGIATSFEGFIDGSASANDLPGRLVFSTSPDGSDQPVERMRITSTGRLGVGTAAPGATLHVTSPATSTITSIYQATSTQTVDLTQWRSSSSAVLAVVTNAGKFGIGTGSPSSTLHVVGDFMVTATSTFAGNVLPATSTTYDLGSTSLLWKSLHVASSSIVVHADTTDTNKFTLDFTGSTGRIVSDAATPIRITTGGNTGINIDTAGNVGIGITSPSTSLQVAGAVKIGGALTANNTVVFQSVGLIANNSGGGCGATAVSTTNAPLPSGTATPSTNDIFYNQTRQLHSRIAAVQTCGSGDIKVTLTDAIAGQTTSDLTFAYTPVSNMGDIEGGFFKNVYAVNYLGLTSTLTGGFDVAEQYPTNDASIEAGDVVTVDSAEPLFIQKVTTSYDARLVGVISTNPALTFGNNKTGNWRKVALTGRVPVKISFENGEVVAGDYLTSSATKPGYAMKMTESGVALGMALESASGDVETVMVMVRAGYQYVGPIGGNIAGGALQGQIISAAQLDSNMKIVVRAARFGVDTLGQAEIAVGDTKVEIVFDQPYENKPIVTITPTTLANVRYAVTNTTLNGFTIEINTEQDEVIGFNWHAFESVSEAKLTVSDGSTRLVNITVVDGSEVSPQEESAPEPASEPTLEPGDEASPDEEVIAPEPAAPEGGEPSPSEDELGPEEEVVIPLEEPEGEPADEVLIEETPPDEEVIMPIDNTSVI